MEPTKKKPNRDEIKEAKIAAAIKYWRFIVRSSYDYRDEDEYVCFCGLRFMGRHDKKQDYCPNCQELCERGVNHFRDGEFKKEDG